MEKFPIQDLHILKKEYAELQKEHASLEQVFNEALDIIDFDKYHDDRAKYEEFLLGFNNIEKQMKIFKKKLDELKQRISN